jgi:hypothetical protein
MKRRLWVAVIVLALGCGVVFAFSALEQALNAKAELPALLPEGALLSIEARDFGSLLHDWDTSPEKRAWLASDNYSAFSNSRLYGRLSQAQDEFSAAAGLPTDEDLLNRVAGRESCLALYDIGNLEFVYLTRLEQQRIESTPLWQTRGKFEQRSEAGATFYVHKDAKSARVAAFAAKDGWLILGTREDLVAGVLDRLAGVSSHNLFNEGWYAEAVKQAANQPTVARGDLRMVLNLDKIVPSPYFRSYWVQKNITEIGQYTASVSDLYRTGESYREDRVLLRRASKNTASGNTAPGGDLAALAALAPEDAGFYAADALPDPEGLLERMRNDLLELKPERTLTTDVNAPASMAAQTAGNAGQLDVHIDQAPVTKPAVDAFDPLRQLLRSQQPVASLEVFTARPPRDGVFVTLQTGIAISAPRGWDENAVRDAVASALPPDMSAGKLGVQWEKHSSAAGDYLALDGTVPLFVEVNGKQLLLANDSELLEQMLARRQAAGHADSRDGITYSAFFRHTREQENFRLLMAQLDRTARRSGTDQQGAAADGQSPAFFSGNMAGFGKVFSNVESEKMEEKDQGTRVLQTVTYRWVQ